MKLDQTFSEHRRLAILRVLAMAPGYRANCSILEGAVNRVGVDSTRTQIRNEMRWLSEQGLATLEEDLAPYLVAVATTDGIAVSQGKIMRIGVQKPAPTDRG
ncbi:hypothetical protein [Ferrovibrio terrae]|uniref:VpaChn25_0724 family phage protein n=1 Tax=Ferrovibrio terrae TaxID=2594003 RepID=UPI003137EEA6